MNTDFSRPWISQYPPFLRQDVSYEWDKSITEMLDLAAQENPQRTAVLCHNLTMTYKELQEKAERLASGLAHFSFGKDSRIAIMLPNLPQAVIAFWGIAKLGAAIVMVNPLYRDKELIANLHDASVDAIILLDTLWKKVEHLQNQLPMRAYFVTRANDETTEPIEDEVPIPFDQKHIFSWNALLSTQAHFAPAKIRGDTTLLIQYTGGTTGTSKGVLLTHSNLGSNALQVKNFFNFTPADNHIVLSILPFFHVYGLSLCLVQPVAIQAATLPLARFDPRETLQTIAKFRPTIFPSAPAMYISLLQQKELANYDLKSIRFCLSGSAPLPEEIYKRFQQITGASILEGYGLTESSPVTHFTPLGAEQTRMRSIGIPLPATDARIVDMEAGCITLDPGKIGELVIRGPQVMHAYLNNPDETASALRNNWLYTGDIATMDKDGYFHIVDRKKDMIIVGGYNVFPREVDEVLQEYPKVLEAVCVGLEDPLRGEVLKAYIVPKPGETITKSEIVSFCRSKLASYKVPRQIEFRDALPRTLVGKILRRFLKDEEKKKREAREKTMQNKEA